MTAQDCMAVVLAHCEVQVRTGKWSRAPVRKRYASHVFSTEMETDDKEAAEVIRYRLDTLYQKVHV